MDEERVISQGSTRTLPTDEPVVVAAAPPVPPLGDAFDDQASFDGGRYSILGLPAPALYGAVLGYDDDSSSDTEFEDRDNRVRFWDRDAVAGRETDLVAEPLMFLGQQTRFASFQGAVGFMRISTTQAVPGGEEGKGGGAIVMHYRLTRFSRAPSGTHKVEVRDFGTALYHVRYLVPFPAAAVADPASSLCLVGAALAADVYPYRHYVQLQALWSGLVSALPVHIPAQATRIVVTVDVGVLRGEDRTPEHVEHMRDALVALTRENDDMSPMDCGLEQHLPVPVCRDDDKSSGSDHRPAKKMKRFAIAAGELCAICLETMEQGLAVWPQCSHIFHGKCLEQLLVTVQHRCPICRSTLAIEGMF